MCALGLEEDPCKCDEEGSECLEQEAEELAELQASLLPAAAPEPPPADGDGDDLDPPGYDEGEKYTLSNYPPHGDAGIVIPGDGKWDKMYQKRSVKYKFDIDEINFKNFHVKKIENKYKDYFGEQAEVYYGSLRKTENINLGKNTANLTGFFVVTNYLRFQDGVKEGEPQHSLTIVVPAMAMDFAHFTASKLCCGILDTKTEGKTKNYAWTDQDKLPTNWNTQWKLDVPSGTSAVADYDNITWATQGNDDDPNAQDYVSKPAWDSDPSKRCAQTQCDFYWKWENESNVGDFEAMKAWINATIDTPGGLNKTCKLNSHSDWLGPTACAKKSSGKTDWDKYAGICAQGIMGSRQGYEAALEGVCTKRYSDYIQHEGFPLLTASQAGTPFILGTPTGMMTADIVEKFGVNAEIQLDAVPVAADRRRNRRVRGHEFSKLRKDETYLLHLLKKR